jgi:hypothetical protein
MSKREPLPTVCALRAMLLRRGDTIPAGRRLRGERIVRCSAGAALASPTPSPPPVSTLSGGYTGALITATLRRVRRLRGRFAAYGKGASLPARLRGCGSVGASGVGRVYFLIGIVGRCRRVTTSTLRLCARQRGCRCRAALDGVTERIATTQQVREVILNLLHRRDLGSRRNNPADAQYAPLYVTNVAQQRFNLGGEIENVDVDEVSDVLP